jgi:hypothetical protein
MTSDIKAEVDRVMADGKTHDPADLKAVADAYLRLVECITVYRANATDSAPSNKN